MAAEETKNDLLLKRLQVIFAILASLVAVVVGIYNFRKSAAEKQAPPPSPPAQTDKIRSALEDVGASWLQTLKKKNE